MVGNKALLKIIRKRIPSFKCKSGCHECCGPVPFSKYEWNRIKIKKEADSINCPYIGDKGCEIYEDRPIVCRLFGTVEKMKCPHGCGPNKMLTEQEEKNTMNMYGILMERG